MAEEKKIDVLGTDDVYKREMKPYEKYRIGNYKVQLVRLQINDKGEARVLNKNAHFKKSFLEKEHWEEIYALKISTLEELWSVRIPQSYGMFGLIIDVWRRADKEALERVEVLLANMLNVTCIPDGFFHNLVVFARQCLVEHIDDKSTWKEKREKYDKLVKDFKWCLDADIETYKPKAEKDLTKEQYHQAEIADEAREELKK